MFSEFREFINPEERDYDLKNNEEIVLKKEKYMNPTKETINKVKHYLNNKENNYKK